MQEIVPLFLTHRFSHHSGVSGYDQFALRWAGLSRLLSFERPEAPQLDQSNALSRVEYYCHAVRLQVVNWWLLCKMLSRTSPQANLMHVLYGEIDLPLPSSLLRRDIPVMATIHQPLSHLTRSDARIAKLRRQLSCVDRVVALCEEQRVFFAHLVGQERVCLIPHGVDTHFFHPGSEPRKRRVLIVGGWLRDWQLAERVLTAALRLRDDFHVRLVSPAADNPLRHLLPQERTEITGRLSDEELLKEYQTCGVVFFPFRDATANNALLEACACGCRIVAADVGGVRDYLGMSGMLFPPSTEPDRVAVMLMQSLDMAESEPYVPEAVARAASFDWREVERQLRTTYEFVLASGCRR